MTEIGARRKNQPAPPRIVFEALTSPDPDSLRPWLILLDDERAPSVVQTEKPALVVWSSLWERRPDVRIRFELLDDGQGGTDLRWVLLADEPTPDESLTGHLRKRMNVLVNANLRLTLGQ